ncbi:hypothetical protein I4U30_24180 [Enterobacter asburiae]|uniref:hypothetical protein n=1 Tax=Enterobacter asburiae TaxID=61645 RepID=UPI00192B4DB2|nr:hypothetical protein [Enterobacter asburiae]MBL5841356.1 hypothetical protein [Enterobacter asburiae]
MKIGFMALLALVFITLKLCGVIAWSWWLVLLPLYFGLALVIGVIVLFFLGVFGVAGVSSIIEKLKKKR